MSTAVTKLRETLRARVLGGAGQSTMTHRKAAFDHATPATSAAAALLDKVTKNAWKVTDEDVAAVTAAGMTEDEIFELVVCAAIGQSTRQLDSALAALAAADVKVGAA